MYRGDALGDGHPPAARLSRGEAPHLTLRWHRNLRAAVDGTPAISGGVVVVGSESGKLAAYRLETGATVWEDNGLGQIMGSAAIVRQQVLVGTLTGRVDALGLRSDRQIHVRAVKFSAGASTPLLAAARQGLEWVGYPQRVT